MWEKRFGFKLFHPNERAIFQIMKPCKGEEEFTHNIAALAILIDQLNVKDMKKRVAVKEGSVNILEEFLKNEVGEFPPEVISNLRDIVVMRSKRFPIHVTDTKFVEVVIRLTGKYPPVWADLWVKALRMYEESLEKLLNLLQKKPQD